MIIGITVGINKPIIHEKKTVLYLLILKPRHINEKNWVKTTLNKRERNNNTLYVSRSGKR